MSATAQASSPSRVRVIAARIPGGRGGSCALGGDLDGVPVRVVEVDGVAAAVLLLAMRDAALAQAAENVAVALTIGGDRDVAQRRRAVGEQGDLRAVGAEEDRVR